MRHGTTIMAPQLDFRRWITIATGLAVGLWLWAISAYAAPPVPWECSNYGEEAQTRCLNAFIEHQREQIDKLEDQLQAQRDTVGQLKGQIDRQAAATADLQRQLSQPPPTAAVPPPYVYPYAPYSYGYAYPPIGFGLYLGRPWLYGPSFYYRPFWGPRFYGGRWGRRW